MKKVIAILLMGFCGLLVILILSQILGVIKSFGDAINSQTSYAIGYFLGQGAVVFAFAVGTFFLFRYSIRLFNK